MVSPRVVIGIATRGRSSVLAAQLPLWSTQTVRPHQVVVCATQESDVPVIADGSGVTVMMSAPGLTIQRNAIIDLADQADRADVHPDLLVFCDDDFFPAPHFVESLRDLFAANPDVVGCNVGLAFDGATGDAVSTPDALARVGAIRRPDTPVAVTDLRSLYGCNMAMRLDVVRAHGVRFDERLATYGWLEDLDFSRRLAEHGRLVGIDTIGGGHMGTKGGRVAETWLGFSQVVNPVYLWRKGAISVVDVLKTGGKVFVANVAGSVRPSQAFRRRRLGGNLRGLWSIVTGGPRPELVTSLPSGR